MCFCRRKTSSKEEVEASQKERSRRVNREQPAFSPAPLAPAPPPKEAKEEEKKKTRNPLSLPRSQKSRRRQKKKVAEDDTITNIPDEMPDLEINREHPEPFYTDEQLM